MLSLVTVTYTHITCTLLYMYDIQQEGSFLYSQGDPIQGIY